MHTAIKHDVAFFDFLRGWSAVLVFFHHAAILGGGPSFLSGQIGQEAVNAFMVASGFLIYFQCATSRSYDQLQSWNGMRNFYIRRFFRIAPAYYFALIAALLISTYLGQCREQIAEVLPSSATSMDRYYIKDYLFSTPLPDWSLGLEMQFYLIFPLLYAGCRRNFIIFMPLSLLLMAGIWGLLSRAGVHYPMPSILPLKFHNFAAGMAWAYLMLNTSISLKSRLIVMSTALIFLILGNRSPFMPVLFVLGCWLLNAPSRERGAGFLERIFAHRSSKFLADISYSLYILHLMLMLPFFAWILKLGPLESHVWLLASCILLALSAALAYVIYRLVEIPGIDFGKRLLFQPSSLRPQNP